MVRKCNGRRKVEMVKIRDANSLMVTFSKRRSGLFKKASELATLCGAEVAIIVFSPGRKAFSFGHPFVERVVDRYLNGIVPQNSTALQLFNAHLNAMSHDLNLQLTKVLNQVEMEKKRSEDLDKLRKDSQSQCWWTLPIEELNLEQLEQLKVVSQKLRQNVTYQTDQRMVQGAAPLQTFAPDPFTTAPPLAFAPDPNASTFPFDHTGRFDTNIVPFGYNYGYGTGFF